MTTYNALGLMSGTSMDGVDVALIETDGIDILAHKGGFFLPYTKEIREGLDLRIGHASCDDHFIRELTDIHIKAVQGFLSKHHLAAKDIDLIGFHGHTLYHAPHEGVSIQIGDGAYMAAKLGISVVTDFRTNDVEQGGQGAPLVPLYHQALCKEMTHPAAVINIGGLANVTWMDGKDIMAFDIGPGNNLMDDVVREAFHVDYDKDGALAASGTVDEEVAKQFLAQPFFTKAPPKSLDRLDFSLDGLTHLEPKDRLATLAFITAKAIADAETFYPKAPKHYVLSGGGRHNKTVVAHLTRLVHGDVSAIDVLGVDGDMVEAEAFAYLAVRSQKKLPLSLPLTTGVPQAVSGGVFYQA